MKSKCSHVLLAHAWQEETKGNANPPLLEIPLFKILRLNDRLEHINTVILGSSTIYGVTQNAFPEKIKIYNLAQNSQFLFFVIPEAEWILEHAKQVKNMLIPLDWSLGFIYEQREIQPRDLSVEYAKNQLYSIRTKKNDVKTMVQDALSYPKIKILYNLIGSSLTSNDKILELNNLFLHSSEKIYSIKEDTTCIDFESSYLRGRCAGYDYDGSLPFRAPGVTSPKPLIVNSFSKDSPYVKSLLISQGRPNIDFLKRIDSIAKKLKANKGSILLMMPPLIPGFEKAVLEHPQYGSYLRLTKEMIQKWSKENNLVILDAGQSERFGCKPQDFIDVHHSLPECYTKVLKWYYSSNTSSMSGLVQP